jgi:hypothetical protein
MGLTLTIQQLAEATLCSRTQIDQWISRGHFKPRQEPERGKARTFTFEDAITLGTLAELVRIGIPPVIASMHVDHIADCMDEDSVLVISQGESKIPDPDDPRRFKYVYDYNPRYPHTPATLGHLVRPDELPAISADPHIYAMAVVNVGALKRRLMASLGPEATRPVDGGAA